MKKLSIITIAAYFLITVNSCSNPEKTDNSTQDQPNTVRDFYEVMALVETDPVATTEDAADDPCIWYNENDPDESRIIGTNKKSGLLVYDLNGRELFSYPAGRLNNVDIRYDFPFAGDSIDIVGATNRTYNSISFFRVLAGGELEPLSIDQIISTTDEVYGFCFYKSQKNDKLYANLVSKSGSFEQYEVSELNSQIQAKLVRTFEVGSQCEGMVADDQLGNLFIGEENNGIWKYGAEPEQGDERVLVSDLANEKLKADIEGLTLYLASDNRGYLIVSSQGNNSYAVFNRSGNHDYLGSFRVVDGDYTDGTSETDGIDIINLSLGQKFPNGVFIVQDGENIDHGKMVNQNFKFISWSDISNAFKPNLLVDPGFDFRE
jgi:3-phytase